MAPAKGPDPSQARQALGAAAALVLVLALAWPFVRPRDADRAPVRSATPPPSGSAVQQVQELQLASEQLKRAAADAIASAAAKAAQHPARAASPADATTCIESRVSVDTFGPGSLDWVCGQPDVWSLQLDLYARAVKRGKGEASARWFQLGRFELGAIAILRAACCPSAAPLLAKVPSSCGSLTEVLTALSADPGPEQARRYEQTMSCLAERKVWFPEGWKRVNAKQSQQAFDAFLASVR